MCEVCGDSVSFRDEATGGFTLKHWDAHRQQWYSYYLDHPFFLFFNVPLPVPTPLRPYPSLLFILRRVRPRLLPTHPLNGGVPSAQKRNVLTTSGRILTLHSSRHTVYYVLRVTSGSGSVLIPRIAPSLGMLTARVACQKRCKRIPLPLSSFPISSIPSNNKNGCALEERNSLLSKDPDVRKFDAERVLCNTCDRWIQVSPENHMQAVQKWLHHRSSCQKGAGQSSTTQPEASSSQ